jgi:cytochrome b involved in lipid metabolism
MGWMKALRNNNANPESDPFLSLMAYNGKEKLARKGPETLHIEDLSTHQAPTASPSSCPSFISPSIPNTDLPFFPASSITTPHTQTALYIVVDNIVYDCTSFIDEHPGGHQVIESFRGQDCSWQFWRFHSKDVMEEWGWRLRVARTEGIKNRWAVRPRWVGLRRLGEREEEW